MLSQTDVHRGHPVTRRDEEKPDIGTFGGSQTFSAKFWAPDLWLWENKSVVLSYQMCGSLLWQLKEIFRYVYVYTSEMLGADEEQGSDGV